MTYTHFNLSMNDSLIHTCVELFCDGEIDEKELMKLIIETLVKTNDETMNKLLNKDSF